MNLKLSGDAECAAKFLKCIFSQDSLIQDITEYENDSKGLGFLD